MDIVLLQLKTVHKETLFSPYDSERKRVCLHNILLCACEIPKIIYIFVLFLFETSAVLLNVNHIN